MKLRINKKSSFLLLFLLLTGIQLKAQDVAEDLRDFTELKTYNAVEVVFIPSQDNRIQITGHSKDNVKYSVVDGELEVRLSLDNIWSKDNTIIRVYGNSIETIDANQGSIVTVNGSLEGNSITLRAQEGASIRSDIRATRFHAKAVTGGVVEVKGKAEEQDIDVNTGGKYFGGDLPTKSTRVSCGTAGRAEINASEYCRATAKLGGVIEVFGRPDELDTKTSLGGRIL